MDSIEIEVYKDVQDQISEMISKYKEELYDFDRKRPASKIFGDIRYLISYLHLLKEQHIYNLEYSVLINKFIAEVSLELETMEKGFGLVNNTKKR